MHGLVSVIVPCYKQAEYLPETLDSVLSQTYSNWECIIVNDGSPDNTEDIAHRYCKKDDRFHYLSQPNQGLSMARNNGIKASEGCFVLPLDADDLIAPTYIAKAVACFDEHPETKLVYCKAEKFGKENGYWDLPEYDYEKFIWNNCIFCTAMFRRSDYDQTIGYNPNMVHGEEDWDFWLSLLNREDSVHRIDEVLFYYRIKVESRSTVLLDQHFEESRNQLCKNHPEIYEGYYHWLFSYLDDKGEIRRLNGELNQVRSSLAYRIGKLLLKPFAWFRSLK